MTNELILNKITEILKDVLDNEFINITMETTAADYSEWDSLAHINFLVAVESQFGLKFSLNEMQGFTNIGSITDIIHQKCS